MPNTTFMNVLRSTTKRICYRAQKASLSVTRIQLVFLLLFLLSLIKSPTIYHNSLTPYTLQCAFRCLSQPFNLLLYPFLFGGRIKHAYLHDRREYVYTCVYKPVYTRRTHLSAAYHLYACVHIHVYILCVCMDASSCLSLA